jgi:hypothetical protein
VAVDVPNARQAVKVSFSTPTMTVVAAPFTASGLAPGNSGATRRACMMVSSLLTIIANSMKPLMTATVATALGTDSRKMRAKSSRDRPFKLNGSKRLR